MFVRTKCVKYTQNVWKARGARQFDFRQKVNIDDRGLKVSRLTPGPGLQV